MKRSCVLCGVLLKPEFFLLQPGKISIGWRNGFFLEEAMEEEAGEFEIVPDQPHPNRLLGLFKGEIGPACPVSKFIFHVWVCANFFEVGRGFRPQGERVILRTDDEAAVGD